MDEETTSTESEAEKPKAIEKQEHPRGGTGQLVRGCQVEIKTPRKSVSALRLHNFLATFFDITNEFRRVRHTLLPMVLEGLMKIYQQKQSGGGGAFEYSARTRAYHIICTRTGAERESHVRTHSQPPTFINPPCPLHSSKPNQPGKISQPSPIRYRVCK